MMPYHLPLPGRLRALWKVKIRDNERLEPPHVTILRKEVAWRYGLRSRAFLDKQPDPGDVPQEILDCVERNYDELCRQGDRRFPTNPVAGTDDDDDN